MKKILFFVFAFTALAVSAQTGANKLVFQKGQTVEVTTNVNIALQSPMGEMPMTMVSVDHYLVNDVSPNAIQLSRLPKKLTGSYTLMGQEGKIDSDDPKTLENPMMQPLKELLKKQEFTIDDYGTVLAMKGEAKKSEAESGMGGMMMPGLGDLMPAAGQPSVFKVLPAKQINKGDAWTDSSATPSGNSSTTYTVKDIVDNDIQLAFTGESSSKGTQSMMGQSVDMATSNKTEGAVVVDKATGLLKQRTSTTSNDSVMNLMGNEMKMTSKVMAVTTVKTL